MALADRRKSAERGALRCRRGRLETVGISSREGQPGPQKGQESNKGTTFKL